jgi:REP element-mobilizing transposase RayT
VPNLPLAYFLTWTCYGTWIHGDDRGSVDDQNRAHGTPFLPRQPARHRHESALLRAEPFLLTDPMRLLVDRTIRDHCSILHWPCFALNVRTNHVHAVVGATHPDPGAVAGQLKAWSTRRLREAGLVESGRPLWTKRASTRYVWNDEGLRAAVDYVMNHQ